MTDTANSPRRRGRPAPLLPDPSPRLNAAYRAIARRMDGLNFVNPAIDVEAVAFAPWESHWLGAMVTPWCINLMLLPRDASALDLAAAGQEVALRASRPGNTSSSRRATTPSASTRCAR